MLKTKNKNFTTTLSVRMLKDLSDVAKKMNLQKNTILEEAFKKWNRERIQNEIREGYKRVKNDPEWRALAEEGLEDWFKQIEKLEQ